MLREIKIQLSEAYWTGTNESVLDEYELAPQRRNGETPQGWDDLVEYWIMRLPSFTDLQWYHFTSEQARKKWKCKSVWRVGGDKTYINIGKVLRGERSLAKKEKFPARFDVLREKYKGHFLECSAPDGDEERRYHRKCVLKAIGLLDDIIEEWARLRHRRKARRLARKSAVAAVMSRNMSHNVGSHVLANLSSAENLEDSLLKQSDDEHQFEWISHMAEFNDYLRTRMGFIADVSTSSPVASTPLGIHQDVFAPFTVQAENISDRAGQRLLLEHVSGLEDLGVEEIDLWVLVNGNKTSEISEQDVSFASPNGLLGAHALYVIIENIIRNSAKHAYDGDEGGLKLTINVKEEEGPSGLIEVSIYDNLGESTDDADEENPLTDKLNGLINEEIIEDDESLNYDGWGVREMKICAAYLRGKAPENLDRGFDPPLLEADLFEGESGTKRNLGYTFYLQRPKEICILDPNKTLGLDDEGRNNGLQRYGIAYMAEEDEIDAILEKGIEHQILVVVDPDEGIKEKIEDRSNSLPTRIVDGCSESLREDLEQIPSPEGIIRRIWEEWVEQCYSDDPALLIRRSNAEEGIEEKWGVARNEYVEVTEKLEVKTREDVPEAVVYDRHGILIEEGAGDKDIEIPSYEAVKSGSPAHHLLAYPPEHEEERRKLALEMVEAGTCGVMLLDERIQNALSGKKEEFKGGELPLLPSEGVRDDVLGKMNVWMPAKGKVDLDRPNRGDLHGWFDDHLGDSDFLVVHLGVLEELNKNKRGEISEEYILEESRNRGVEVIVTSGRGRPPLAVECGFRFLHYSQVANPVLEERSKYHLVRALSSARRLRP